MKFITEEKKNKLLRHITIPGDVVIAKMADPVARAAIVADDFFEYVIVADCVKITPDLGLVNLNYLVWAINSDCVRINAELVSTGTTRIRINLGELQKLKIPYPSDDEQKAIAAFLDHETAKIDALIEKQRRLIELLKEKRQAVISHAVTKGLNPNAPMKDSGVEWLGEVPAHWVVTKAKFVANVFVPQRNKPDLNDENGVPWATMEDMKGACITGTRNFVNPDSAKIAGSKTLKAGAVIASCVGNFGVASINKIDVIINQQLQAYIPISIKAEYLRETVLTSKSYFEQIGTAATLVYVNQQGFENLPVLTPPIIEQEKICTYIEKKLSDFEDLISKSEVVIRFMQERRTALISAAVTGKIDVRDWQPSAT